MSFDALFANPAGRTARGPFAGALVTLLAAVAFYVLLVKGVTGQWCLIVFLAPGLVLHARRLHDMGRSAWPLAAPAVLVVAAFSLRMAGRTGQLATATDLLALAACAGFVLWGLAGRSQPEANRFGAPAGT